MQTDANVCHLLCYLPAPIHCHTAPARLRPGRGDARTPVATSSGHISTSALPSPPHHTPSNIAKSHVWGVMCRGRSIHRVVDHWVAVEFTCMHGNALHACALLPLAIPCHTLVVSNGHARHMVTMITVIQQALSRWLHRRPDLL